MPDRRPDVQRRCLEALRDKYVEMRRMRVEHAAGTALDPRADMRALAARFPGALREIDELSMEVIEGRVAELERVLDERCEDEAPPWARWLVAYHGWMRVALRIKRASRGDDDLSLSRARFLGDYQPGADEPPADAITPDVFRALARPDAGRLNPFVLGRVADAHGTTPDAVARALFRKP